MTNDPTEQFETVLFEAHKKNKRFWRKLLSPVTRVLDSVETDFEDRTPARKMLISLFKLRRLICLLLAAIVLVSAVYFLLESNNSASVEMSLNYEESAKGLNPNSTRFSIHDVMSQEMVEKMLVYSGIDPESVDINSIIDCISVRPTNKKEFSEEDYFISTTYKITMKMPPNISGVRVSDLLNFLCKAYKDNLYANYTENRSILNFDIAQFHQEEYLLIADQLDLKGQQIAKYLNGRVKQSKSFVEKESDESFKSLVQKVDDIRNYDIAKYRVFVIEEGCSKDKATFIRSISYINQIENVSFSKDMAAYNVYNDGIKMFDKDLINVVMIPSIDPAKNTYYMSKTKTGMDYMATQANDYLLSAQATAKTIKVNQDIISKMNAGKNDPSTIEKANEMIENIMQKFSDLSRQIEAVDKAYIKYKTKDYLTFKTSHLSLMQKLNVSTVLSIAVLCMVAICVAIWIRFRYFRGGKKE